jgi:hypothetical protein
MWRISDAARQSHLDCVSHFFSLYISRFFTTLLWRSLAELHKRIELEENISVWRKQGWTSCLHLATPIYDRRDYYSLSCRNKVDSKIFWCICIRVVAHSIRKADLNYALSVSRAETLDLLPSSGHYCFLFERSFVQFLVRKYDILTGFSRYFPSILRPILK